MAKTIDDDLPPGFKKAEFQGNLTEPNARELLDTRCPTCGQQPECEDYNGLRRALDEEDNYHNTAVFVMVNEIETGKEELFCRKFYPHR
jgi:hypothetical protein